VRVEGDEAVGDEGEVAVGGWLLVLLLGAGGGGRGRGGGAAGVGGGGKGADDAAGAEDVDLGGPVLRLGGAQGEEGLDGVVG
jgi:hypothetical protein